MDARQNNPGTMGAPDLTDLHQRLSKLRARSITPPLRGAGEKDVGITPRRNAIIDSGYGSVASSPDSHKAEFIGRDLLGTKLKFFNRPILDQHKARFFDLKVLYTQPLVDAISKKKTKHGDISMKLKYLGNSEQTAELYIVVQCEKKVAKKVRKFFAQEHVQEDLRPDFRLFVLDRELMRLEAQSAIDVLADSSPRETLCGISIKLFRENISAFATLGGVIMIETSECRLYGLTAGHPLKRFQVLDSTLEGSESDTDDDEDDSESSDSESELGSPEATNVLQSDCHKEDFGEKNDGLNPGVSNNIGTVFCDSFSTPIPENYDWAIINLTLQDLVPNMILPSGTHRASDDHRLGQEPTEGIALSVANSQPAPFSKQVTVLSNRGPLTGVLALKSSCLMMNPGSKFVDTHDLTMEPVSSLYRGDSGSWVVDVMTGEVYGHVVSVDAFGEAQVMPIESTLANIKEQLQATRVSLPTPEDVRSIMHTRTNLTTLPRNEAPGSRMRHSTLNPEAEPWVPSTIPMMPQYHRAMEHSYPQASNPRSLFPGEYGFRDPNAAIYQGGEPYNHYRPSPRDFWLMDANYGQTRLGYPAAALVAYSPLTPQLPVTQQRYSMDRQMRSASFNGGPPSCTVPVTPYGTFVPGKRSGAGTDSGYASKSSSPASSPSSHMS